MNADTLKKLKYGWLTASAVGVLLAAQGSVAAGEKEYEQQAKTGEGQKMEQQAKAGEDHMMEQHGKMEGGSFSEVDQDGDGEASVSDIRSKYEDQLAQTDWDEQKILDEFDQDDDQSLNADEFETFKTVLNESTQGEQQAQLGQQEQQGQEQQAELGQQEQQAEGQQEFEQQAELETEQQEGQQTGEQEQQFEEQAELEQERDQEFQTEQDQEFESGQQQEQEFGTEQQQAQQDRQDQQDQQFQTEQQQAQAGQAGQQAKDIDTTLLSMPVDQVAQAEVVNSRGEEIGQVSEIVRDETTGELALVVRSGGILGLGGSSVLVDLAEVSQMDEGRLLWDTMMSQDEISEMPEYDETQYSEISETEYATLEEAQRG
jgi:sporulation protein YlmC with PRC-barrel domain